MELVFDEQAVADLEGIFHWIAQDSPAVARTVVDRLFKSVAILTSFPYIGRAGREAGTLEWVVPRLPYVVVYEVDNLHERVVISAIFHGAQDRNG
jgi:toxin ParE1/3/4